MPLPFAVAYIIIRLLIEKLQGIYAEIYVENHFGRNKK